MKDIVWQNEIDKIIKIVNEFSPNIEQRLQEAQSKVAYEERCLKSSLHRGYYCPSLIRDIVTGNVRRGKIQKRKNAKSCPTHTYGFDAGGRLILSKTEYSTEIIVHQGDYEIGVGVDRDMEIRTISVSHFVEGLINSYSQCLYDSSWGRIIEIDIENYMFLEDELQVDCHHAHLVIYHIFDHTKYIFKVKNGYLVSYTVEDYENGERKESVWDGHVFEVTEKRKID